VFGTTVTERTRALEVDLSGVSTPVDTCVKSLDHALRLVGQAGLSSAEDRILTNYLHRPQIVAEFAVGDFVFVTNTRPILQGVNPQTCVSEGR